MFEAEGGVDEGGLGAFATTGAAEDEDDFVSVLH